jgi:hypothetical protein
MTTTHPRRFPRLGQRWTYDDDDDHDDDDGRSANRISAPPLRRRRTEPFPGRITLR